MDRSSPAFEQRIYSPQKISAVVAELVEQGSDAAAALDSTGLQEAQLHVPSTRISYRQFDTVFRNALRLSKDPAIALRAGRRMHVTAHGIYGYALLSSPSIQSAIDFSTRYAPVMGPLTDTTPSRRDETMIYTCVPLYWADPAQDIYRFVVEFALSMHLTVARDFAGPSFRFSRVHVGYAAPPHAESYRQLFECPVHFDQPTNQLHYDVGWLEQPLSLADPISNATAREVCDKVLLEIEGGGGLARQIRQALLERPGWFPDAAEMAAQLAMHPRALRRRLEVEQTSYRAIVADVRMRLAIEYLRGTSLTNEDIANRLGYSDAANFRHAFARWTGGRSPSDYRPG